MFSESRLWNLILCGKPLHYPCRSTIICYRLACNQNKLLSAFHAIQTFSIKLICFQTHLLSTQLGSHSFAIRPQLLSTYLLSSLTCYQTNLLSILSCNQQFFYQSSFALKFWLALDPYIYQFLFLKIGQKK